MKTWNEYITEMVGKTPLIGSNDTMSAGATSLGDRMAARMAAQKAGTAPAGADTMSAGATALGNKMALQQQLKAKLAARDAELPDIFHTTKVGSALPPRSAAQAPPAGPGQVPTDDYQSADIFNYERVPAAPAAPMAQPAPGGDTVTFGGKTFPRKPPVPPLPKFNRSPIQPPVA